MKKIIGVIGPSECTKELYDLAYQLGTKIAENNFNLICGGKSGVMEACCKGAKKNNGLTIGVLPEDNKDNVNQYVDIPIVTGFGEARNIIIVKTADILVTIGGGFGTLSEIAFALKLDKPLIALNSEWAQNISDKVIVANSLEDVSKKILKILD